MGTFFETIGAMAGKLANTEGLMTGLLSSLNPRIVADAVNKNGNFMTQMIDYLDPKVLAAGINSNPAFMNSLIKELEPSVVAGAMNRNIGFMTKMIAALNANVFTDSAGVVISKMKSTFSPQVMAAAQK